MGAAALRLSGRQDLAHLERRFERDPWVTIVRDATFPDGRRILWSYAGAGMNTDW
jgi:hypothetical protein